MFSEVFDFETPTSLVQARQKLIVNKINPFLLLVPNDNDFLQKVENDDCLKMWFYPCSRVEDVKNGLLGYILGNMVISAGDKYVLYGTIR
jgi:hypothetical protein